MAVPNDPGVPPLLGGSIASAGSAVAGQSASITSAGANVASGATDGSTASTTTLMTADSPSVFKGSGNPMWGIFLNGQPVVTAESVMSLEYRRDYTVSDFPLEMGAFESYDKVQSPYEARVRFAAGRSEAARQALANSIDAVIGDLKLYDVVTPTKVYTGANLKHQEYRRTAQNGVKLLQIDVGLEEIRIVSANNGLQNTQAPSGMDQVNGGTVQTTDPTATQQSTGIAAAGAAIASQSGGIASAGANVAAGSGGAPAAVSVAPGAIST